MPHQLVGVLVNNAAVIHMSERVLSVQYYKEFSNSSVKITLHTKIFIANHVLSCTWSEKRFFQVLLLVDNYATSPAVSLIVSVPDGQQRGGKRHGIQLNNSYQCKKNFSVYLLIKNETCKTANINFDST